MSLAVFETIGPLELLVVLGIVLLIFGPKRLPGLGRQLGASMREFKDSISSKSEGDDDDSDADDTRRQATAALGRPEEEPATKPVSDGVASEQR
jgi:sec-independent protein translocase protein TatA